MKLHTRTITQIGIVVFLCGCAANNRARELREIERIKKAPPTCSSTTTVTASKSNTAMQLSEAELRAEWERQHPLIQQNLPPEDEVAEFPSDLIFGRKHNPSRPYSRKP